MKFVVGENGKNPVENLPRPRFVHHKTHIEGPRCELGTPAVGGKRLTTCATRPPGISFDNLNFTILKDVIKKLRIICNMLLSYPVSSKMSSR